MSYVLKKTLITALRPLAAFSERLDSLRRLWASARLNCALACTVGCLGIMKCSQYFQRVVIVLPEFRRYDVGYDEDVGCDARSQNHD